ncbi:DNA-binding storekeeper protein-related transcriptional regulator [Striga hermonthica]|uniref:DNA-binding storekeeper protein-related transcriptional regulator n=1 Tax=Striga hermonthica TaxID=68872 RepID=A0A9N7RC53_STRHE|nr:DNA-binding storekeeper protein-related transcriptional regulator [Striga hermonthica]
MDSTLIQPQSKPSVPKLPVKRKTPDPNPDPSPEPIGDRSPPFKFHRIWTEPDEIRFLQGLLDCSSQSMAFPRDLGNFYARFSNTMSQPYTKSQLSEKLRRLRKKFRVTSARLSKGLGRSQLSTHDRALYDLSKQLWHTDYAATSPFCGARNVSLSHSHNNINDITGGGGGGGGSSSDGKAKKPSLVGIKVDFSPTLPVIISGVDRQNDAGCEDGEPTFEDFQEEHNLDEGVNLSEVNVKLEEEDGAMEDDEGYDIDGEVIRKGQNGHFGHESEVGELAAKVVMNVFDDCFNDLRRRFSGGEGVGAESFQTRWQRQRIAELDVLGGRLRLVLENSLRKD